jgi:hypothetical protein
MALDRKIAELGVEIEHAERNGDMKQIESLIIERTELTRKRVALNNLRF